MIRALPLIAPQIALRPLSRLGQWAALARQRRALARLDDAALSDIGLSRDAAQSEASRPFWDAPSNWRI
ncbi:DUF1127 domain-containing protein [Pacificoceanicola onchidii]|uniref:DUF1127 domain-containing protein n=1 Tax=Pacificoceanicola onchidii TaxID=2562685 RepID=UPI0010A3ABEC|nr:DUF1127 domain-containing protein [Pacificoceanicola onchidii]